MKSLPNIISILRILLSVVLLFIKPLGLPFMLVYSICGISDMLDGYIARKTNSTSKLGSLLDSIGDMIFIGAVVVVFSPILVIQSSILIWIVIIVFLRVSSVLVVYFKYGTFAILHTYLNKLTGLCLFCFPYLYTVIHIDILAFVLCFIASLSSVEELVINIMSRELEGDTKGLFIKP